MISRYDQFPHSSLPIPFSSLLTPHSSLKLHTLRHARPEFLVHHQQSSLIDFGRKSIQVTWRRPRQDLTGDIVHTAMARTFELAICSIPVIAAP